MDKASSSGFGPGDIADEIPEEQFPRQDRPREEEQPEDAGGRNTEDAAGADEGTDHHGRDGDRDTTTVSQAQQEMHGDSEQRLPAMSQNNATDEEKLAGILAQTRADLPGAPVERISELLRERADQAGVPLGEDDARRYAEELSAR